MVQSGPTSSQINPFVPQDAASLYALLEKGQHHRQSLIHRKDRLYNHLQHVQDMDTSHLYQLVGVQLDDFVAFESLVFGMLGFIPIRWILMTIKRTNNNDCTIIHHPHYG
ncbi:unnamed protein product [Absidia cylindrospora]